MTKTNPPLAMLLATRRQVLLGGVAAGAAMLLPRVGRAASVAYDFECDRAAGFVMDPNQHKRVGYFTEFSGVGLTSPLAKDLNVTVPWSASGTPSYPGISIGSTGAARTAKVVGILEKFTWAGGVGDPLKVEAWLSQQNAMQLKSVQQSTLKNTQVSALGWSIIDFDQEVKTWYEASHPQPTKVTGLLKPSTGLNVDLVATPVKDGINVMLYKVSLEVAPAANQVYPLHFASSSNKPVVKSWGLQVGSLASEAAPKP